MNETFKIIGVDNFDRDTKSDFLVATDIKSERFGKVMVETLNKVYCCSPESETFFKLVPTSHKLFVFEP